jgi:hypothetical protein
MPLINSQRSEEFKLLPEVELLKRSGIIKSTDCIESRFLEQMQEVGLDSKSILARIAILMDGAENDGVKLAAAKLALQMYMHPALVSSKNDTSRNSPQINFQINVPAGSATQLDLNGILKPDPPLAANGNNIESW